jgi:hypothetical protein
MAATSYLGLHLTWDLIPSDRRCRLRGAHTTIATTRCREPYPQSLPILTNLAERELPFDSGSVYSFLRCVAEEGADSVFL